MVQKKTVSPMYSSLNWSVPMEAPRCLLPSVVMLIGESLKSSFWFCSRRVERLGGRKYLLADIHGVRAGYGRLKSEEGFASRGSRS